MLNTARFKGEGLHASVALIVLAATPSLPVTLQVQPDTADGAPPTSIVFRVKNTGDAPIHAVDHRGLLAFDIRVPGKRAPVRCRAPARPSQVDPERIVELAPGDSAAEVLDLRWVCWGKRAAAALATPGATIVGRYGFGRRRASSRAWVASSVDGTSRVASLEAEPVSLPAPRPAAAPGPVEPTLSLTASPERIDSSSGRSVAIALRLRNEAPDDTRVLVRPEMFRFNVRGPGINERCALPSAVRSPMRESFTRLRPRARTTQLLDLTAICPERTFARPGVYDIETVFESDEDGSAVGLLAFTGSVTGGRAVLRVTTGDLRSYEPREPPREPAR